jgi:hypothetical protein
VDNADARFSERCSEHGEEVVLSFCRTPCREELVADRQTIGYNDDEEADMMGVMVVQEIPGLPSRIDL